MAVAESKICERWGNFADFLADMGRKPTEIHELDRVNNDGNYEPGNCRWATPTEQNRNRRSNRRLTIDGVTQCVTEWAEMPGAVDRTMIYYRLDRGWDAQQAVFLPKQRKRG